MGENHAESKIILYFSFRAKKSTLFPPRSNFGNFYCEIQNETFWIFSNTVTSATTSATGESPQHFMTAEHMDPGDLPVITEAYNPGVIHPFHSSRKNFTGLGHVQVSLQQKVETEKNFILTTAIVFFLLLLSLPR